MFPKMDLIMLRWTFEGASSMPCWFIDEAEWVLYFWQPATNTPQPYRNVTFQVCPLWIDDASNTKCPTLIICYNHCIHGWNPARGLSYEHLSPPLKSYGAQATLQPALKLVLSLNLYSNFSSSTRPSCSTISDCFGSLHPTRDMYSPLQLQLNLLTP